MDDSKIDVSHYVAAMERTLRTETNLTRRVDAVTVLWHWQFDHMVDDVSREKARRLVEEFRSLLWRTGSSGTY